MSKCFSCGEDFSGDVHALLRAYKKQYVELGIVRFYYKLSPLDSIKICKANSFNVIHEKYIKPNIEAGAEFAHIAEYQ